MSNEYEDDLDAYAENAARRAADRESRLARLALLKRQQLENDEEERQKSAKKQASSRASVLSTSPVKSPQKQPAAASFNYNSPSKNHQFLPSFNSPQRSFVLTKSIEKSPARSPVKSPIKELTASPNRTPLNSPEKLATTPLQQSSINLLNFSPKPYKSPTQAKIAAGLARKLVDFSAASLVSGTSTVNTNDILSPTKSFNDTLNGDDQLANDQPTDSSPIKRSPIKSVSSPVRPVSSPTKSLGLPIVSVSSPTKSLGLPIVSSPQKSSAAFESATFDSTTPTGTAKSVSPVKTLNFNLLQSSASSNVPSTASSNALSNASSNTPSNASTASKSTSLIPVELSASKRSTSPLRLFSSVKSSNPIRVISPIKQASGVATPERLCVSDKKKLFENAIAEETENARRVEEQKMFLLKKKFPGNGQEPSPSLPKKIKTSIMQFESRAANESPSWVRKATEQKEQKEQKEPKTNPKIVDVDMKKFDECEDSIRPGDEISKFISQVEDTQMIDPKANTTSDKFENSLHSIREEDEESIEQAVCRELDGSIDDLLNGDLQSNLVKSSTKANLYPSLSDLMDSDKLDSDKLDSDKLDTNKLNTNKLESTSDRLLNEHKLTADLRGTPKLGTPSTRPEEPVKQLTPMRTLSQYRREQKNRAMNGTPSQRVNAEDDQANREEQAREEKIKWDQYREEMRDKMIRLKTVDEKYEKIMAQSSNAISTCLKNSEQRGSRYQLEAERILLVTTQKRTAVQQEIDSIKSVLACTKGKAPASPLANGCVTFERIQLPLKGDFIVGQISDQDPLNHHFICVARCGEQVAETELLSSADAIKDASITFDHKLQFKELDMEFEIQVEVYGLALLKEKERHQDKKSLIINSIIAPLSPKPSRKKATDKVLSYSANQGFIRLGLVKITKENLMDEKYSLEEFMYNAPFSGELNAQLKLNASYNVELRDYLNFFDQTGPYPIWNRRWCVVRGYLLAYWRFAEDETVRPSLGVIDLRKCVNKKIGQVSYEICARSNTFQLALLKEVQDQDLTEKQLKQKQKLDRNKLHKTVVVEKNLISTDMERDMKAWCNSLNRLLSVIRVWEEDAVPVLDGPY